MGVKLKPGLIVVAPPFEAPDAVSAWLAAHEGQVFALRGGGALVLKALGPAAEACREPVRIDSRSAAPLDLVSNFAATPFELDGAPYASVEGFWQGLKFAAEQDRRRVGALWGGAAKRAGDEAPAAERIGYGGAEVRVGTWEHWALMERACRAKFEQHEAAAAALLGTGTRPLVHRTRRDSRTIPGVVMAEIWMRIRASLRTRDGTWSPQE